MTGVADTLSAQSRGARLAAWLSVALIVATVFSLVAVFFLYQREDSISVSGLRLKLTEAASDVAQRAPAGTAQSGAAAKEESDEIKKMRIELQLKLAQIANEEQQNSGMISVISSAVARVGAVLIGLYLVSILLSLTRYHFKLADHLLISAESIRAFPDDLAKVQRLSTLLSTKHVDFGKEPQTPTDKAIELVKEALGHASSGSGRRSSSKNAAGDRIVKSNPTSRDA